MYTEYETSSFLHHYVQQDEAIDKQTNIQKDKSEDQANKETQHKLGNKHAMEQNCQEQSSDSYELPNPLREPAVILAQTAGKRLASTADDSYVSRTACEVALQNSLKEHRRITQGRGI